MYCSRTDANVEHVRQMICSDHQLMIQIIVDELNINRDCLEDYPRRFEHDKNLCKGGAKIVDH